jgi:DNA-binding CsgD family transcriptional regulator
MVASRQTRPSVSTPKEAVLHDLSKAPLSSDELFPVEILIRKLIAAACTAPDAGSEAGEHRRGRVILDAEVDGVRCLVTRLEEHPPSEVSFSPRESEIARMVAKGYPNKTIAGVLDISSWKVCTHLRRMFAKLGVSSRAAMVAKMMDLGMLGIAKEREIAN